MNRDTLRKIGGLLLLVLFLEYFGSNTLFMHSHVINGVPVTHSHPYPTGKAGGTGHTHTSSSIHLLHHLSAGFLFIVAALFLPELFGRKYLVPGIRKAPRPKTNHHIHFPHRGPPAFR